MIQDIAPHRFDNTYRPCKPQKGDFALCVQNNQTLLVKAGGVADSFAIPDFTALENLIPGAEDHAVYLFSIDDHPYFLIEFVDDREISLPEDGCFEWKKPLYFRAMQPIYQGFAGITATQVWRWRKSRRYCGHCGNRTEDSLTERALVCPVCKQVEYPKISPAIIVGITHGDKLLMTHYSDRPNIGYALIAGFVEIGESFETTIQREVWEEVGLKVKNIQYFKSQPWAFSDTEMIGFFAELDGDDTVSLEENELAEAVWLSRDEIPHEDVLASVGSEMKMAFKYGTWK